MQGVIQKIEAKNLKAGVVEVQSGDTVRVHQRVKEGSKTRVQVFEGLVIKTGKPASLTASFTVRRIASGVGVEKSFLIHSPSIVKVEVVKRSKVRRNYLSYMRELTGKSARLTGVDFDKKAVNAKGVVAEEPKPEKVRDEEPKEQKAEELQKAEATDVAVAEDQPKDVAEKQEEPAKTEQSSDEPNK